MSYAIETQDLSKIYGTTRAVSKLNLQVPYGEVYAFLGPNGAGKSTTIRVLLALQRPTSGSARVLELDSQRDSLEIHRRVGYLPGDLELYPRMTGQHHIDWFARAKGGVDRDYLDELTKRFDVVLNRPVHELSKGNRQKIGVVLAFMTKPELLVLDEPTVGLDPLMQNEFERLVRETIAEGRTVFLSSHELDEVQRLADTVAIIKEGELLVTNTVEKLSSTVPKKMEVRFRSSVSASRFESIPGVKVSSSDGVHLSLELTGDIAPVLKAITELDPIDLVSRPADLSELFLSFYSPTPNREENDAH